MFLVDQSINHNATHIPPFYLSMLFSCIFQQFLEEVLLDGLLILGSHEDSWLCQMDTVSLSLNVMLNAV